MALQVNAAISNHLFTVGALVPQHDSRILTLGENMSFPQAFAEADIAAMQ